METLLEAEDDELPAPAPTPMKGAKGKEGAGDSEEEEEEEEEEDDDDDSDGDAVPRMSLTPARAAAHHQRQQQQGQQQRTPARQPKPAVAAARLSTPSAASVPSLRLPAVAPGAAAAASEDKENAPVQQEAARRSSGLSSLSSSDTLPKPALPTTTGVAASPSTPGRKMLVRTSLGSPQRSPSPAKPSAPFQSPLAGGAVRVPTGGCAVGSGEREDMVRTTMHQRRLCVR